jgi:hypothetical protein
MAASLLALGALLIAAQEKPTAKLKEEDETRLRQLQPKIDAAIDKGVAYLIRHQNRDGSWSAHTGPTGHRSYDLGITALGAYTLLKAGLSDDHPAVKRALIRLKAAIPRYTHEPTQVLQTYDAGCMLMAFEAAHDKSYLIPMQAVLKELLSWQKGTWSYGKGGTRDLSNTQYAVLGLRACELAGLAIPPDVYLKLYEETLKYQEELKWVDRPPDAEPVKSAKTTTVQAGKVPLGGFRYRVGDSNAEFMKTTGSMTAAGVATAAICRQMLRGKLDAKAEKTLRDAEQGGVVWLARNFSVKENPGKKASQYEYYLYGLERVGSILDVEYIGARPWYLEGAAELVARQAASGSWGGESDTCFGVLFLKRATRVSTGETRAKKPSAGGLIVGEDPVSEVHLRAIGMAPMEIWISGFPDAVQKAYGTGAGPIKGLRVARVEYLVNGAVAKTVPGNPKKAWAGDKYQAQLSFERRGTYALGAQVHLVAADAPAESTTPTIVIKAKEVKAAVSGLFEEWMTRAAEARRRNLLIGRKAAVKAGSIDKPAVVEGGELKSAGTEAKLAVDGLQSTYWACKEGDAAPWISVELDKPVEARTIVLGQLNRRVADDGTFDRIKKVEIAVNGGKPFAVELEADDLAPTFVPLAASGPVKKLEIKILERAPGKGKERKGRAGFTEIGLEADRQ